MRNIYWSFRVCARGRRLPFKPRKALQNVDLNILFDLGSLSCWTTRYNVRWEVGHKRVSSVYALLGQIQEDQNTSRVNTGQSIKQNQGTGTRVKISKCREQTDDMNRLKQKERRSKQKHMTPNQSCDMELCNCGMLRVCDNQPGRNLLTDATSFRTEISWYKGKYMLPSIFTRATKLRFQV